jgi:hypothetical protein
MAPTWTDLEAHVRRLAGYIWNREAKPDRIAGVNIDCVVRQNRDYYILIEITEERSLQKTREDIIKLVTARNALNTENIYARCYCVVGGSLTQGMVDAGKDSNVDVVSVSRFQRIFFDFDSYKVARERRQFGSAINPLTGERDDKIYTPVTYTNERSSENISISELVSGLSDGNKSVVMTGEYGSGKSRCVKEMFALLAADARDGGRYPIAIDLRECWGLKRASEIIRRHFEDLGLDTHSAAVLRALNANDFVFLLDGFDELGFQSWTDDSEKIKTLRARSLEGVRDLISRTGGSVFVSGRAHYFNTSSEMFAALGLPDAPTLLVASKDEFTESEMAEYMGSFVDDYDIPAWLPRRPLICQAVLSLAPEEVERLLGDDGNDIGLWEFFVNLLCERDARINPAFYASTIFDVLVSLARITRTKPANVGPISLGEIQSAFEAVVGQAPDEQASVMLQRLPSLGRVAAESNDRQFIDMFILDGLRAIDLARLITKGEAHIDEHIWRNPLDKLGQRVLAKKISEGGQERRSLQMATRCASGKNRVLACDVVAASVQLPTADDYDFNGLAIDEGEFVEFDMTNRMPVNLGLYNTSFGSLTICPVVPKGTKLKGCVAEKLFGVTSANGLPSWADVEADQYLEVQNVASIRRLGLKPAQEILVTIVRKTFFQKGAGRKEEALLRGLGRKGAAGLAHRVVNILLNEGLLRRFPGSEGTVYTPERSQANRMRKMLDELNVSQDSIWSVVSAL